MALLNEYIALDFGNKNKMIIEMSFLIATNIDSVMRSSLKLNWFLFFLKIFNCWTKKPQNNITRIKILILLY